MELGTLSVSMKEELSLASSVMVFSGCSESCTKDRPILTGNTPWKIDWCEDSKFSI